MAGNALKFGKFDLLWIALLWIPHCGPDRHSYSNSRQSHVCPHFPGEIFGTVLVNVYRFFLSFRGEIRLLSPQFSQL